MKVLLVNVACGTTSTGKICAGIAEKYEAEGHEVKVTYSRSEFVTAACKRYAVKIGSDKSIFFNILLNRITDREGLYSKKATKQFLEWAEEYNPDVLWLHNLHGYYINYEMLFKWIKSRPQMQVKWTLHDCWAFTGHCAYFDMVGCNKWKDECKGCPQKTIYPASYVLSNCNDNFNRKKRAFTGVNNMTIITPSNWLGNLVKESFLKEYPVEIVHNEIDKTVFKPLLGNFKSQYGIENKKMILGVASVWEPRKGLNDFIELSKKLNDDYKIVLVGLNKKQLKNLPKNIIGLERTKNQKELVEIYTVADVFVNMTYEDNYPTVNLEAKACGTPILTYNTGGSPESAGDTAVVVETGDINAVCNWIIDNI